VETDPGEHCVETDPGEHYVETETGEHCVETVPGRLKGRGKETGRAATDW
jgi:hypothetical protein